MGWGHDKHDKHDKGGGLKQKKASVGGGGVWIFPGTTHCRFPSYAGNIILHKWG